MGLVTRPKAEREQLRKFGLRIQHLRKLQGISQEKLAVKVGYSRAHMGFVEQGRINVPLIKIFKIANILKVKPSELFQ